MRVPIWDGKYIITSDPLQYIAKEVKTKQEKADKDVESEDKTLNDDGAYEVTIGHFKTISYLYKFIASKEQLINKCTTQEGFMKHCDKVNAKLELEIDRLASLIDIDQSFEAIMKKKVYEIPENVVNIGEHVAEKSKRNKKKKE